MAVITLLFFAFYFFSRNVVSSEKLVFPCQTPDTRKGFCVSIFDCPELIALVHELGEKGANFAKESLCLGCVDNDIWVCCKQPRNSTVPSVLPVESIRGAPPTSTTPNSVPNKNIIPDTPKTEDSLAVRKTENLKKLKQFTSCGEQHSAYRLRDPGEVEIDEFPWLVQIKHTQDEPISMRCNGVIIERRHILTTSKCGHRAKTALLGQYNTNQSVSCKIQIGHETDCTEPTKELLVTEVAHSNKAPDDLYGLTLLKVSQSITYTDHVRTICLPLNRTELSTTENKLHCSGWADVSGNKKDEEYKRSPAEKCFNVDEELKEKIKEENISLMCLSNPSPKNKYCAFDFGGPLMYLHKYNKWYLDGFISNGDLKDGLICSNSDISGIYLTPKLLDFIISNMYLI